MSIIVILRWACFDGQTLESKVKEIPQTVRQICPSRNDKKVALMSDFSVYLL